MTFSWKDAVICGSVAGLACLVPLDRSLAQQSVAFNNHCRTCHSVKEGDNRLGPSLHGIFGAKAGSAAGYGNYSQALKSSGVMWDEASLDEFIANPEQVIPNNNMKPYAGLNDANARKEIVAFLKASG